MKKWFLVAAILISVACFAQGVFTPPQTVLGTVNGVSRPIAGATITVCASNASGLPCSTALVNTIFRDSALTLPLSNPFTADSSGNYQFSAAPGAYTVTETATGFAGYSYQLSIPTTSSTLIGTSRVDLTGQTGSKSVTTIITPSINGFYRISCYTVLTRAAGINSTLPACALTYVDADSGFSDGFGLTASSNSNIVGTLGSGSTIFYALGGAPIQYSTTGYLSGGSPSMQYSIRIRLEGPF